jgi:HigB_toxin, RelE-like toxic component of a toxin-antitoxin system
MTPEYAPLPRRQVPIVRSERLQGGGSTAAATMLVGRLTVFNISGNRVRLIAAMHYNRQRVYVRAVLTHAEYDEGRW